MPPSSRKLAAALGFLGICLLVTVMMLMRKAGAPPQPPRRLPLPQPAQPKTLRVVEAPVFGSGEFGRMLREGSLAWLETRQRDAGGLIVMWDITGDKTWLLEAADRFPDHPAVAMAMLEWHLTRPELEAKRNDSGVPDPLLWTGRLRAADPGNPVVDLLEAMVLEKAAPAIGKEGPSPEHESQVQALLEASLAKAAPPDLYLTARRQLRKEAALAAGATAREAARFSMSGGLDVELRIQQAFLPRSNFHPGLKEFAGFKLREIDPGPENLRLQVSDSLLAMPGLSLSAARSILEEGDRFLKGLDPNLIMGDTGETVGSWLQAQAEHPREEWALLAREKEVTGYLGTAPESFIAEYAGRYAVEGEVAAMRWAVGEIDRAKENR